MPVIIPTTEETAESFEVKIGTRYKFSASFGREKSLTEIGERLIYQIRSICKLNDVTEESTEITKPACGTCDFGKSFDGGDTVNCRRGPPIALDDRGSKFTGLWPSVRPHDFCGEYKEKIDDDT